jgi:cytochrome P450
VTKCSTDDWVDGKFLPKGTVVIVNAWGIHHDETKFQDPETFSPARYSSHDRLAAYYASSGDYENRDHYVYGAGRRLCPGIHLAERNLFIAVSKLLWAFDFVAKAGEGEVGVDPVRDYSEGFLHCPKPFGLMITPRSETRRLTVMKEFEEMKEVFWKFEENITIGTSCQT